MSISVKDLEAFVCVCDHDLQISRAAESMDAAQSSVSKWLWHLEESLGGPLVVRHGRRLVGLTQLGAEVLRAARTVIVQVDNIQNLADSHKAGIVRGLVRIGTTHTQARYILPPIINQMRKIYPHIFIQIFQNSPAQLNRMLVANAVDLIFCTETSEIDESVIMIPTYEWNRVALMLPEHPLAKSEKKLNLKSLAEYPLVTYHRDYTGRRAFDQVLMHSNLKANVVVTAVDADVLKTYVRAGVGLGVLAQMAYDETVDTDLVCLSLAHLFPPMNTKVAYRKDKYIYPGLRGLLKLMIEQFNIKVSAHPGLKETLEKPEVEID